MAPLNGLADQGSTCPPALRAAEQADRAASVIGAQAPRRPLQLIRQPVGREPMNYPVLVPITFFSLIGTFIVIGLWIEALPNIRNKKGLCARCGCQLNNQATHSDYWTWGQLRPKISGSYLVCEPCVAKVHLRKKFLWFLWYAEAITITVMMIGGIAFLIVKDLLIPLMK